MAIAASSVEHDQLYCPGCQDPVLCEPPTGHPELAFCHRDGSVLCGQRTGALAVEPESVEDWGR
jgi:hypothetical protein